MYNQLNPVPAGRHGYPSSAPRRGSAAPMRSAHQWQAAAASPARSAHRGQAAAEAAIGAASRPATRREKWSRCPRVPRFCPTAELPAASAPPPGVPGLARGARHALHWSARGSPPRLLQPTNLPAMLALPPGRPRGSHHLTRIEAHRGDGDSGERRR
jgi:hypothetical protein